MTQRAVAWARSRRELAHIIQRADRALARQDAKRAAAIAKARAAEQEKVAER